MIKKYRAQTGISINIVLPSSKKNIHLSFSPLSNGSSEYITDNTDIQRGIERHSRFGKLFQLVGCVPSQKPNETKNDVQEQPKKAKYAKEIHVNDISEARDYLADVVGVSRTKTRSEKSIFEQAKVNGIKFIGL